MLDFFLPLFTRYRIMRQGLARPAMGENGDISRSVWENVIAPFDPRDTETVLNYEPSVRLGHD